MEPCGTPGTVFVQLLNVLFIFMFVSNKSKSFKYSVEALSNP